MILDCKGDTDIRIFFWRFESDMMFCWFLMSVNSIMQVFKILFNHLHFLVFTYLTDNFLSYPYFTDRATKIFLT